MSFYRSLAVLCVVSLIAGAGLCALQAALTPVTRAGAYAALITSAEVPDEQVRASLSEGSSGFNDFSDSVISESSQWVLLDDFSGLKQIPLDEYYRRVLPLDPRNDGYALRLRSFFVRGDQRLLFIPLHAAAPASLEKRLEKVLENIPFSLELIGIPQPIGFFFILFGSAAAALLLFRFWPRRPRMELSEVFFCLPVLAVFAFNGAAGFILAALLVGTASLLREPLAELCTLRRRAGISLFADADFKKRLWRDVCGPFKWYLLIAALLMIAYFLISVFLTPFLPLSIAVYALFAASFVFSVKIWARRGESQNHIRFLPLMITKPAMNPLRIAVMLPFLLAAVLTAVSTPALPAPASSPDLFSLGGELISEDEYLAHAAFQASFSLRPLGAPSVGDSAPPEPYPAYALAPDNLIEPLAPLASESAMHPALELPPFPLKSLMEFLADRRGDKLKKK